MKILHLIIDHQVIERVLKMYDDLFPDINDILIFSNTKIIKHLNSHLHNQVVSRENIKSVSNSFDFSCYDYIIAHYLTFEMIDFISHAPRRIHVCWDIYGGDLYDQFLAPFGYPLQYIDKKKYNSKIVKIIRCVGLYNFVFFIRTGSKDLFPYYIKHNFKKIIERLDSIAIGCEEDAELLEKYSGKRFKVIRTFNYSLKETLGELYDTPFNNSKGIMIGNSASLSNNHLYVLNFIKGFNLDDSCLIMPLSYGGIDKYKEEVISQYDTFFHDSVRFVLNYMPLSEYNKTFLQLRTMVMASWRQESIGTIVMGLYLGIKIFMSNKSPLYRSFKKDGFLIFEIENVKEDCFLASLTMQQKAYNRELLLNKYDESKLENELKFHFRKALYN